MSDIGFVQFHDAELISVELDRAHERACLTLSTETRHAQVLELNGVKAFRCEDLTVQNVVSRILLSSSGQITSEDMNRWLSWTTSLSDSKSWLGQQRRNEWIEACTSGAFELFILEPSAGAQVAAVCTAVRVRARG